MDEMTSKKRGNLLVQQAGRNWLFNVNLNTYDYRMQLLKELQEK